MSMGKISILLQKVKQTSNTTQLFINWSRSRNFVETGGLTSIKSWICYSNVCLLIGSRL